MEIEEKSEFSGRPVLESCAFFSCIQCGYCGYLILGGSARELLDEKQRHTTECKAINGSFAVGSLSNHEPRRRVPRGTRVLKWSAAVFIAIARWLETSLVF